MRDAQVEATHRDIRLDFLLPEVHQEIPSHGSHASAAKFYNEGQSIETGFTKNLRKQNLPVEPAVEPIEPKGYIGEAGSPLPGPVPVFACRLSPRRHRR